MVWLEQSKTWNTLMATNALFTVITIASDVLLLKLITNSRKFMARMPSFTRRATDGSRSSTAATIVWRTYHNQEPQSCTTGRGHSQLFEQILRIVCGSGPQSRCFKETIRRVFQEKGKSIKRPRVVPHDLTPAQLKKHVDTCILLLDCTANTQCIP